jgi:hypothetical protein
MACPAELGSWKNPIEGQRHRVSSPRFVSLKSRPEWEKPGVYLLVGDGATDDMPRVYVGEGDPVGDRLAQHEKNKDFWSRVVFFTSKDEKLNKAHVQYLESRLTSLAREAKRCARKWQRADTALTLRSRRGRNGRISRPNASCLSVDRHLDFSNTRSYHDRHSPFVLKRERALRTGLRITRWICGLEEFASARG